LIDHRIRDGIEGYIVLDKPGLKPSSESRIILLLRKHSDRSKVNVKIYESDKNNLLFNTVVEMDKRNMIEYFDYTAPDKPGVYKLILEIDGVVYDEVEFIVDYPLRRQPLYFTIVWHHHQAPNYLPDGRIHSPWAFKYVWERILEPYGYGPYHYHAVLLHKHPGFKSTYNLSPSLLAQWSILLEKGVIYVDGRRFEPGSDEAFLVEETISYYREALMRGQIDVLTSIYAHTIAGFLIDFLGMEDIIREEVEYGYKVSREVLGFKPEGVWTPEMAFSMKLVRIYYDLGLKYTILDDVHHYSGSQGEKDTPYKPYIIVDCNSRKHIYVFFRDQELSNILSFKNNFVNEFHAWRNAYEFSYRVLTRWLRDSVKTLVLALDGENWMIFSKNPPLTAYFLDILAVYLESMHDLGFIYLSHLSEILKKNPPSSILYHIPTNSWLGSFNKWVGEVEQHHEYWRKICRLYSMLKNYEEINGRDEYSLKARWALWHALDSDYWWAEFWYPKVIDEWINHAENILKTRFKTIATAESKQVDGNQIDICIK